MRRILIIALGTAAALVTAAFAFAVVPADVGVREATATFSATLDKSKTRSCTADLENWETTDGRYTGMVDSEDAVLAGSLAIHARTTYNATDGLGIVSGSFTIKDDDTRVKGEFSGTIQKGELVGYLTGKSRGNHVRVLGNLSATFAGGDSGFADGKIGEGSSGKVLAVVAGRVCKNEKSEKTEKSQKTEKHEKSSYVGAKGEITDLTTGTPGTITVTGKDGPKTCSVDAAYAVPADFPVGTKDVEMKCEIVGDPGVPTLRKLRRDS